MNSSALLPSSTFGETFLAVVVANAYVAGILALLINAYLIKKIFIKYTIRESITIKFAILVIILLNVGTSFQNIIFYLVVSNKVGNHVEQVQLLILISCLQCPISPNDRHTRGRRAKQFVGLANK